MKKKYFKKLVNENKYKKIYETFNQWSEKVIVKVLECGPPSSME